MGEQLGAAADLVALADQIEAEHDLAAPDDQADPDDRRLGPEHTGHSIERDRRGPVGLNARGRCGLGHRPSPTFVSTMLIDDRTVVALPERVKLSPEQEQDALRHQAARRRRQNISEGREGTPFEALGVALGELGQWPMTTRWPLSVPRRRSSR